MARSSLKDLNYAAGFLDGEGCFGFYSRCVRVECNHTHRPSLLFLSKLFGGRVAHVKAQNTTNKKQYNWRICGLDAVKALEQLEPFLKEKRSRAKKLIVKYKNGKFTRRTWRKYKEKKIGRY